MRTGAHTRARAQSRLACNNLQPIMSALQLHVEPLSCALAAPAAEADGAEAAEPGGPRQTVRTPLAMPLEVDALLEQHARVTRELAQQNTQLIRRLRVLEAGSAGEFAVGTAADGELQPEPQPSTVHLVRGISPQEYVGKLRAGDRADVASLSELRGRLCRGREPKHFQMLGYGDTCFVLGGDGLALFLDASASAGGGAPLEMLIQIGYDILDIYEKLRDGWVFDLVVWDVKSLDAPHATWQGVADVFAQIPSKPKEVAREMRRHLVELRASGSGAYTPEAFATLQQQYKPAEAGYTFKGDDERLDEEGFSALVKAGAGSAAAIRKYLYDCAGLNDLYGGKGCTVLANGEEGINEYLAVNQPRVGVRDHMSTAIGAPTLEECLKRIAHMYEELNKKNGVKDHHLARWLSLPDVQTFKDADKKTPMCLSPKQLVDKLRKGETLGTDEQLEGVWCRLACGDEVKFYGTSGGPRAWNREMHLVGAPHQLQRWLHMAAAGKGAIDFLTDISYSVVDMFNLVKQGKGNQLTVFRGTLDGATPDIFPATFDGVMRLCKRLYPDVVGPLREHKSAVLEPMDQAEYEERLALYEHDKRGMTYESFLLSPQGAREVRFFVDHTLSLRGGWNGSGYERQFVGGGPVPMFIALNRDYAKMESADFDTINLGQPKLDDVITLMCAGLAALRAEDSTV